MKIKKGDQIIVTLGKDKGRKGKVEKLFPKSNRVLVPGVSMYKKHEKKRDERRQGGIIEYARPISVAKIAVVCPKCSKQTRVGFVVIKGERERICKKCEARI